MKLWCQTAVGSAARLFWLALALALASPAIAETTPTPTPTPEAVAPAATPSPTDSPTLAPNPDMPTPDHSPAGAAIELTPRPSAFLEGKANRDEIYAAILSSLAAIKSEVDKAGLKPYAHPIAVFLQADDDGFRYRAEIPLESAPPDKTELSSGVKLGLTPAGKAMRFEHRGAYDDIDATYEAITAYLDEKNIDAQDVFMEEYLNDVKTSDDPNLQVDIYVLLK